MKNENNAIIIGASSGIGEALARLLSREGYRLGICARRRHLLMRLQSDLSGSIVKDMDLSNVESAVEVFRDLLQELGGTGLVIITAGTGFINPDLEWQKEKTTIDVNVRGFCALANAAIKHFLQRGKGHLVVISSVAGLFGSSRAPAYNASKAFVSNYLEGLQAKMKRARLPIAITDIRAGFVDTAMAKGPGIFWMASPEKAACEIYHAIKKRKPCDYVTRRWRLIAWLLKILPHSLLPV